MMKTWEGSRTGNSRFELREPGVMVLITLCKSSNIGKTSRFCCEGAANFDVSDNIRSFIGKSKINE